MSSGFELNSGTFWLFTSAPVLRHKAPWETPILAQGIPELSSVFKNYLFTLDLIILELTSGVPFPFRIISHPSTIHPITHLSSPYASSFLLSTHHHSIHHPSIHELSMHPSIIHSPIIILPPLSVHLSFIHSPIHPSPLHSSIIYPPLSSIHLSIHHSSIPFPLFPSIINVFFYLYILLFISSSIFLPSLFSIESSSHSPVIFQPIIIKPSL